jgi:hypothetical protein
MQTNKFAQKTLSSVFELSSCGFVFVIFKYKVPQPSITEKEMSLLSGYHAKVTIWTKLSKDKNNCYFVMNLLPLSHIPDKVVLDYDIT